MKKRNSVQIRTFKCPDCGAIRCVTKSRGRTGTGHIKNLYCTVCKKEKKFVQTEAVVTRA